MAIISYPYTAEITGYDEEGLPIFDRALTSLDQCEINKALYTEGVVMVKKSDPTEESNLEVISTSGMQVKLTKGICFVDGTVMVNPDSILFDVANSTTMKRIDRIVIRKDLSDSVKATMPYYKKGVPAVDAVPPDLIREPNYYEISVAKIVVPSNAESINDSNIFDERDNTEVCGLASANPMVLDTAEYTRQVNSALDIINSALDGTVAGQLQTQIDEVEIEVAKKGNCNARFLQGETIPTASWVATTSEYLPESMWDQFLTDYPFMADLVVAGVDDTWKADVLPDLTGQSILSAVNMTLAGKIRFYAKEKPEASILLLNVELRKAVT